MLAVSDTLIDTSIALGITLPPTATRNTWPLIRGYLVTQCGMSLVQQSTQKRLCRDPFSG